MTHPSFSFVVPACNVALYVKKTIESMKAQTVKEFEALILCEQSKDNTLSVIREAVNHDSRFQVIELPCSGSASVSRNYGIMHAKGDYLIFVDGDDWIEPDTLERFGEIIRKYGPLDMLLVDWILHTGRTDGSEVQQQIKCHFLKPETVYSGIDSLAIRLQTFFQPGSPANVCRREFLRNKELFQVPGRRHQDCEWTPRVNFEAERVLYFPFSYYHYIKRPQSVTTRPIPKSMTDLTDNIISVLDFRDGHSIPPKLEKPLADWFGEKFNIYFSASYAHDYAASLRKMELHRLFRNDHNSKRIASLLLRGGISKQILLPILFLANLPGGFAPAGLIFRRFYQPVLLPILRKIKGKH